MSRILVVDDDHDWLKIVDRMLHKAGHDVRVLADANAVVMNILAEQPDLVITDIMMPGISGSQVHALIRSQIGPKLPVIVCSSTKLKFRSDDPLLVYCQKLDAPAQLIPTIDRLLESSVEADSTIDPADQSPQGNQA